jgi:circadian clock protein KaiC
MNVPQPLRRCSTGVPGLDQVLCGGLPRDRIYLIDGTPGVGKTTLALQFLLEGVRAGESCLYVTLSETRAELDAVADSHGWDLHGISIIELSQIEKLLNGPAENTLFQPAEMELNALSRLVLNEIARVKPARLVLDSLSEMRLLAQNPLRYRRQILTFKQKLTATNCTVLLLDDHSAAPGDEQVHSIVHGIVSLMVVPLKFGINRRVLSVTKIRGSQFSEGNHDYVIGRGGLRVFPRLVAAGYGANLSLETYSSGNPQLDILIGGGVDAGTSTLLIGPAGSGKSTIASLFLHAAAVRGQRGGYFAFDENIEILLARSRKMGLDFSPFIQAGIVGMRQVDPAQVSPGQLTHEIVRLVQEGLQVVVLDSLNGYINAMPQEEFLNLHLHELLAYLNQQGVITIMTLAQHGLVDPTGAPVDISYLADSVLLTRYFEGRGSVRKAISIIKKRSGSHETTIRELSLTDEGVVVGEPLVDFEGVLTGVPRFLGGSAKIE